MMAIKTAIHSLLYDQCLGKLNAVHAELPVFRLSEEKSERVSRKSGGIDGERTIWKFRKVVLTLGLRNYLPCWISS